MPHSTGLRLSKPERDALDALVTQGHYSSRSEAIRSAIKNLLEIHKAAPMLPPRIKHRNKKGTQDIRCNTLGEFRLNMRDKKITILRRTTYHCGSIERGLVLYIQKKGSCTFEELENVFKNDLSDSIIRLERKHIIQILPNPPLQIA